MVWLFPGAIKGWYLLWLIKALCLRALWRIGDGLHWDWAMTWHLCFLHNSFICLRYSSPTDFLSNQLIHATAQAKICKLRIVVCQSSIWRVSVSVLIISVLLALGLNLLIIYLLTLYPSLVPIFLTVKNHLPVSRILWNKFGSHRYIFRMIMCSVKEWVHFLLQAGFWGKVLCSPCSLKLVM